MSSPRPELPSTRALISSILSQLSVIPAAPADAASPLPQSTHSLLITLNLLLPSHLVPALNLLDRKLITRLPVRFCTYYVASQSSDLYYEVRPGIAWNCTCSAFTFATFNAIDPDEHPGDRTAEGIWGGSSATAPICAHLLACVLAEYGGPVFSALVREEDGAEDVEVRAGLAAMGDTACATLHRL